MPAFRVESFAVGLLHLLRRFFLFVDGHPDTCVGGFLGESLLEGKDQLEGGLAPVVRELFVCAVNPAIPFPSVNAAS